MRVCFVGDIYPVAAPEANLAHGGAEVQQLRIARWLTERKGWDVSFVVLDHGQASVVEFEGLVLHRSYAPDRGLRFLRSLHPRATQLWRAMSRARADVYYQRCAGLTTGLVSLYCQVRRRPFVFAVANDRDLDGSFERDHGPASRILYRFGLEHSDRIVLQTQTQERLLEERGGGPSIRVSNVCSAGSSGPRLTRGGPILWAGSFDEAKKRPGLLLDLARALPHRSFVAIGAGADLDEFLVRARARPNVRYEGIVPWSRMDEVYERIDLVVSTAAHEGFNNVMLEAWARGIPVVSLDHDPDEVICRHGLGAHSRSLDRMASDVEAILGDPEVYARSSAAALDYVRAHHDPDRILDGFAAALAETVRRRRSLPSRCRMLESRRFLAPPAPRSSVRDRSR